MAKKPPQKKTVETLTHDEASRKNIPTAEFEPVMREHEKAPIRVAYERRNRDLDPQLVWRGKDEQDAGDLVVHAPPLYIQEKVQPKVLIDDLLRVQSSLSTIHSPPLSTQIDLFADFNGMPKGADKTDFYQHDQNWSNRMILGDSLQVMASLAEREGLRGKVQCIYLDPPYGIKFNSNFQWSTTSRDVKDGNVGHITREPEQVKAFRDTWRDGIHSYLTYLRDRLTVARDLLTESGSIFVQIGDDNVHRVRAVMDEVFGEGNFITVVMAQKTGSVTGEFIQSNIDYVIWYARKKESAKFRQPFVERPDYTEEHIADQLQSDGLRTDGDFELEVHGRVFKPKPGNHWKVRYEGAIRVGKADRLIPQKSMVRYKRCVTDFSVRSLPSVWSDTSGGAGKDKIYVVQSNARLAERCILMATDPGDLVLDPTCGSGTTAYVAEQWGRRWITIDTSRVALALARARIMGARYPFYLLADDYPQITQMNTDEEIKNHLRKSAKSAVHSPSNIRQGFVYERVPHVTLKSIANNAEIDVIWEKWQAKIAPLLAQLSEVISGKCIVNSKSPASLTTILAEWEIPRDFEKHYPPSTHPLFTAFWQARIARQKEIDASIAAKAEFEFLYDKPYVDKKTVRVAGPFTVESLSPHRVLGVDENDELVDSDQWSVVSEKQSFAQMVLDNLKTAGVQQAHKEDKITFTALTPWPGRYICAEGQFEVDGEKWIADSKTGHPFPSTNHYPLTTNSRTTLHKRAGVFIGPEFGTVQRADLVEAARECGDANFDVLIACAFNYEARTTEFGNLGRIPVMKARMNADLHMAADLKNNGKGNLFVIFGEPDIEVASEEWLVDSSGRRVAPYEIFKLVSGIDRLAEVNRLGREDLCNYAQLSRRGEIWDYLTNAASSDLDSGKHRGRAGKKNDGGVSSIAWHCAGFPGGSGDLSDFVRKAHAADPERFGTLVRSLCGDQQNAPRAHEIPIHSPLNTIHLPLSTIHFFQVTIHGVDVFKPQTGEVQSDSADGIACWFIDTDYNEESFFVRHAYFLGASDPYGALKTTLKAEINEQAWATLHSDTSRPFDKPTSGRIAVKVINHLGDEVMKVFKV